MYEDLLQVAIEAARRAGQTALRFWDEPMRVSNKGPRDIITDADVAAEEVIVATIRRRYPLHPILAEESGQTTGQGDIQWIIDPLDGTTNYSRRLPVFCVSVAATQNGRPVVGAIYDPIRRQMYHAIKGGGAFCNQERLHCGERRQLEEALILFDWPHSEVHRKQLMRSILDMSPLIGGWRSLGSAALGLVFAGAGIADAYLHPTLSPWDLAAAGLIVEEAGGIITALDGAPHWWEGSTCLASNETLHGRLLALLDWQPPSVSSERVPRT